MRSCSPVSQARADAWIRDWLSAQVLARGGFVRRKCSSVEKYASVAKLCAEVERRRWWLAEMCGQYVVSSCPLIMEPLTWRGVSHVGRRRSARSRRRRSGRL